MRILILTFYYEPDLSAGSFRATALVRALRERAPPQTRIDVLTTLPNRYGSFKANAAETAEVDGVEIERIRLPDHRSDIRGQSKAFLRFAQEALRRAGRRKYDLVFATSSRLMTAVLGAHIAQRQEARLYLDIRDIFADTMANLLSAPLAWPIEKLAAFLERRAINRATRVNLVSPGFYEYFHERYPSRSFSLFTNGIDEEFLELAPSRCLPRPIDRPVHVLYAGNIGEGQCLHAILPGLADATRGHARFTVIGDGGRRAVLEDALRGVDNVEVRDPMPRADLLQMYRDADVLFLHLGDYAAFRKVLPSKIFEYAALGKPIVAGVAGYPAEFVRQEISNAAVFAPGDVAGAAEALKSLRIEDQPRNDFIAKFRRRDIMRAMADEVLGVIGV
jgi:glycosyltransferase involved in cell wall biosynthesis